MENRILNGDILEHLKNPKYILNTLKTLLKEDGLLYISVPNIAFLTNRLLYLQGKFEYTNIGIMDDSHLRFFTKSSILGLAKSVGLKIIRIDYVGNFTQLPLYMKLFYPILGEKKWWRIFEYKLSGLWPEGLAVQFLLICKKR